MIRIFTPIVTGTQQIDARYGTDRSGFSERVIASAGKIVRIQTERRDGLVFMRAKKRTLYSSKISEAA